MREPHAAGVGFQRIGAVHHGTEREPSLGAAAPRPLYFEPGRQRSIRRLVERRRQLDLQAGQVAADAQTALAIRLGGHFQHRPPIGRARRSPCSAAMPVPRAAPRRSTYRETRVGCASAAGCAALAPASERCRPRRGRECRRGPPAHRRHRNRRSYRWPSLADPARFSVTPSRCPCTSTRRCTKSLNGRNRSTLDCMRTPWPRRWKTHAPRDASRGRGAQENRSASAASPPALDMNLSSPVLKSAKRASAELHRNVADPAGDKVRAHAFIAKFRLRCEILHARPTLAVVQGHPVERAARQKQAAAVAKREMPYRAAQHHIRARQAAGDEGPIQPGERPRPDQARAANKSCVFATLPFCTVAARVNSGEEPSAGCCQAALPPKRSRRDSSSANPASRSAARLPVRFQYSVAFSDVKVDGLRKLRGQLNTAVLRVDVHLAAALGARDGFRSGRADPARGPPAQSRRREISPAPEPPRISEPCCAISAIERIGPFTARRDLAQPVARALVRQQAGQRQQRFRAQIARASRADSSKPAGAAAPAHVELRVRIAAAGPHRAHPPARRGSIDRRRE